MILTLLLDSCNFLSG